MSEIIRSKGVDVLLAYPRPTDDSPGKQAALSIFHPGALFSKQGLRVAYFDQRFDPEDKFVELVKDSREVAVSIMTGVQSKYAAGLLQLAKQVNPGITTAAGGPHVQILPNQVLAEPFVDKIYPERDYGERLSPYNEQTKPYFMISDVTYLTSTGCPYGCRYCAQTRAWWPRPIQDIDRDLSEMHDGCGFSEISYVDPNLAHFIYSDENNIKVKVDAIARVKEIGAIHRRLGIDFSCAMRVPSITPEMVETLLEARCIRVFLGCESGSERVLRKVARKGHGVEAIKTAARNLSGSGISTMYSFIGFMPGESIDEIKQTMDLIDFIVETDKGARVSVYHYTPFPGTPMCDDAIQGKYGYPKFEPPVTLNGWGTRRLMNSPIYWIAGLNFRMDNTRANFPGEDYALIAPYVELARSRWRNREIFDFPCEQVEALVTAQVRKWDLVRGDRASNFDLQK
jgi:hypothetical protein